MLIDCHTHLDAFPDDEIDDILNRARCADVSSIVSAGTTLESSWRSAQLSSKFDMMWSGVGIHPTELQSSFDDLAYGELREVANSSDKVVAISEIGLDFMEGSPDRSIQYPAFREQIRLARELHLPIIFHSRDAHQESLRVLREEQAYEVGGAMHYFSANLSTAKQVIDLGFYISVARPLLRSQDLQKTVAVLPIEYIVLETDSAPQPFKAKRENWTEPKHVKDVAKKLAELQGKSLEEVETITSQNTIDLLSKNRTDLSSHFGK